MKKRKAILLISFLPVVIYLCASFYQVKLPGPYYDELIFLVDSLELSGNGGEIPLHSQFINTRIGNHKIPLMHRVGYMGPGKTYFFAAVFSIFSPSISTVRYTTSLLGFLSLVFTFLFVRKCFNGWSAFLSILYLATDPTFVILSRNDHGPVVLMMLCKMGALFFLLKWWREDKLLTLSMGMFLLGFLLRGESNLKDRWGDFSAADNHSFHRLRKYFNRNNYLYLFHSPQFTLFPSPRELFEKTLKELNYRSQKVKNFCDHNGIVIYEIFRVEPQL